MKLLAPLVFVASFCVALPYAESAELSVPHFFSDHMVLQQQCDAAIWGTASPGDEVMIYFKGNQSTAKADQTGRWRVTVKSGGADSQGAVLTIAAGSDTVTINDVLVGEVWIASGQSNMFWSMDRFPPYQELLDGIDLPGVRMFDAASTPAAEPQDDIQGEWLLPGGDTAGRLSAVAFFFAKKLHDDLGVPVGIIEVAWGGKPVETFTSREALNSLPETRALVERMLADEKVYDAATALELHEKRLAGYQETLAKWQEEGRQQGKPRPKVPEAPVAPIAKPGNPGVLFNGMIHPVVGYTLRGAIWYQGEANAKPGAVPYDVTLPLLIEDWRKRWGADLAFNFVQLANFKEVATEPGNKDPWPLLQDRQRRVLGIVENTGMAVINDVGDAKNIHPTDKIAPGNRLARWALARTYGHDIIHSGPLYQGHEVQDGSVKVTFAAVGRGLQSRDGKPLGRFEIAGRDKVWHWADARIVGDDAVVVSSSEVRAPVAVRYAWAANPEGANLVNSDGLPTSIFRTDDWDDVVDHEAIRQAANLLKLRALGVEMRQLNERRNKLEARSEEWKKLGSEILELRDEMNKLKGDE